MFRNFLLGLHKVINQPSIQLLNIERYSLTKSLNIMKKISFLFTFLIFSYTIFFFSACSKEENIKQENISTQKIIINDKQYEVTVKYDPTKNKLEYMNAPNEISDFFKKYGDTFVPHVLLTSRGMEIYYYKDLDDFSKSVQFEIPSNLDDNKLKLRSMWGAEVQQWEHWNSNNTPSGNNIITNFSSIAYFDLTGITVNTYPNTGTSTSEKFYAYGSQSTYVGKTLNDKISAIRIRQFDWHEPTTYIGYWDGNYGSRRLFITKSVNGYENTAFLWQINANYWFDTWNDKISSYKTFQSRMTINGALAM